MHTCKPSLFLHAQLENLQAAVSELAARYDYISVLGTDSKGVSFRVSPTERRVADSSWSERGFVFRAQKNGTIVEYAFNVLPEAQLSDVVAEKLDELFRTSKTARKYPQLADENAEASRFANVAINPFSENPEKILDTLEKVRAAVGKDSPEIVYCAASSEFVQVNKIFISPRRRLEQSFIWCQGYLVSVAKRGDVTKETYQPFSGLKGLELLDEMLPKAQALAAEAIELLDAQKLVPGEYEVIADPDVTGLIAHEAFGHGVEMDMFVKGRALAPDYMGKSVASSIVTMYDGAEGQDQCGTYLFDDEGTLGTRTLIIKDGILVAGISDLQSAMSLGTKPTGNGRRQAFDHKTYTRMTNTYIQPGKSTVEEMIASIKHGYLLQRMNSGMEDPKNWGIQLVLTIGREIKDGKLSGKVVSPVVCSGYVPEMLSNITMISGDFALGGSGACGKGYKEFAKVSAGGPYLKTKMRLG